MQFMRRFISALVLSLTLAAIGSGGLANAQADAVPAIAANAPDPGMLRAIEAQVSQIRGLQPMYEPRLAVLDSASLRNYLIGQFDRDYLPGERESDQKAWVALGLIKSSDDLVQIQLALLSDQVIGVYDPDTKGLVVVGNEGPFGPAERITYAHEFNHALQDQYYDLNTLAPKHPLSNDRSLAVHALIEGDAVLLQTLWASANLSQDELIELSRGASGSDASLTRVPLVVRTELLFPYVEGFNFVRQAYRQAGNNYSAVEDLFKNPPESTAQLLHFEKYRNQVHPVEVELEDVAARLGPEWRHIGGGVLGELDTRVLLEQWGSDRLDASRVAAGWAGDRWQLVEKDGRSAIVVRSTWESPDAARSFFSAYARGLRTRFDAAVTEESSGSRQALTTPVSATDMRLEGNQVLTVIAFDRQTANAMIDAVTTSAGL